MDIQKVVIIEDDPEVRTMLETLFKGMSYLVETYASAESFLLSGIKPSHAVYVIDDHLPGIQGSELVGALRTRDLISPIFMISGQIDEQNKRQTLLKGADDFLTKPFDAEHLAIRIKTAVDRANIYLSARIDTGIKFIPQANTVMVKGRPVALSDREYKILCHLIRHAGEVVSREELARDFDDVDITMRTIDVHISSIRKKLEGVELSIETLRGKGYLARFESMGDPLLLNGRNPVVPFDRS